jgi:hypothetical protein
MVFFPSTATGAIIALVGLVLWQLSSRFLRKSTPYPLPPGPPGEPILGHLRIVPSAGTEYAYAKWGKEYGERNCRIRVFGV